MNPRYLSLCFGWLLFGLSMFLPSLHLPSPGPGDVAGWACVLLTFWTLEGVKESISEWIVSPLAMYLGILALCNVLMVLSIPLILLRKWVRFIKVGLPVAALLVCAAIVLPPLLSSEGSGNSITFLIGYYAWALSFVIVAIAVNGKSVGKKADFEPSPPPDKPSEDRHGP